VGDDDDAIARPWQGKVSGRHENDHGALDEGGGDGEYQKDQERF
jgi:hypothetical protein